MELSDTFTIPLGIDAAWRVLTDIGHVAACVPGARLDEVRRDSFTGSIRVKLGPVTTDYAGQATVVDLNETDHKIVLEASGLDTDDEGAAEAVFTVRLEEISDTETQLNIDTDLTLTGRMAQLGKGLIPEVGGSLIARFADNLIEMIETDDGIADPSRRPRRRVDMPEPEAIDLMDAARTPILRRIGTAVAVVLVVRWLIRRRRR